MGFLTWDQDCGLDLLDLCRRVTLLSSSIPNISILDFSNLYFRVLIALKLINLRSKPSAWSDNLETLNDWL